MGGDLGGEVGGCIEGVTDLGGVAVLAVEDPGEGEFEAVAAAAALQGQVCEVVDFGVGIGGCVVGVEEVGSGEGVCSVELAHICAE